MNMTNTFKMNTLSIAILMTCAIAVTSGIHFLYANSATDSQFEQANNRPTDHELATMNQEIAELKRHKQKMEQNSQILLTELETLRSQLAKLTTTVQEDGAKNVFAEENGINLEQELTPEAVQKNADDAVLAQAQWINDTFNTEEVDAKWSQSAQNALQDAFLKADIKGFAFENAVCQKTLCRVKLNFDENVNSADGFREIQSAIPWEGAGFSKINTETGEVEVFLAREGYDLPHANVFE